MLCSIRSDANKGEIAKDETDVISVWDSSCNSLDNLGTAGPNSPGSNSLYGIGNGGRKSQDLCRSLGLGGFYCRAAGCRLIDDVEKRNSYFLRRSKVTSIRKRGV